MKIKRIALFQRRVHVDQPAGGGGRAGRQRQRGAEPGAARHQHRAGGAPPHRGRGGGGGPWRRAHQLARREAAHAPARRLPLRPNRRHLHRLQHVNWRYTSPVTMV